MPVPNKDISNPPFTQLFLANLPLIAPIMKDDDKLIEMAISNAVKLLIKPVLTMKYGSIGNIPPIKNEMNITIAPFIGLPRISRFRPNSSVSIVFNQTPLLDVILFTTMFNSSPANPLDL